MNSSKILWYCKNCVFFVKHKVGVGQFLSVIRQSKMLGIIDTYNMDTKVLVKTGLLFVSNDVINENFKRAGRTK